MELEKISILYVISGKPIKTRHGLLIPLWYFYSSNPFKIIFKNAKMRFYEKEWGNSLQIYIDSSYFNFFHKLENHIICSSISGAREFRSKLRDFEILKNRFIWGRSDDIKNLTPNNVYFGDVEVTLKHIFIGEKGASACWIVKQVIPTKNQEFYFDDWELP